MTPYPLLLGSTRLLNFGNLSSLPIFSLLYAYPFSRKCLPYPFIRHISTLPVYLIFKNIPLYPLIRVYPFIRHLRVVENLSKLFQISKYIYWELVSKNCILHFSQSSNRIIAQLKLQRLWNLWFYF